MRAEFVPLLTETVTVAAYASQDAYGRPVYGAGVVRKARMEQSTWLIRTTTGQEQPSHTRLFLDGAEGVIDARARVTLPGMSMPLPIQRLNVVRDLDGTIDHYLIYL
jgi:hypothetical protein